MLSLKNKIKKLLTTALCLLLLTIMANPSFADPSGRPFDGIEIGAENFFPMRIGGIKKTGGNPIPANAAIDDTTQPALCICPDSSVIGRYVGMSVSFFNPFYLIEVTKTPFYSPTLGVGLSSDETGELYGGSNSENKQIAPMTFQNVHVIQFPLLNILGLMRDFKCVQESGSPIPQVDYLFFTEIIPQKQDDLLAALLTPDAYPFAHIGANLSAIPDALSSQMDLPLNPLWYSMGSWGLVYPLTNHTGTTDNTFASQILAGKTVFEMCRDGILLSRTADICQAQIKTIWDKKDYKLQRLRPTRRSKAFVIGKAPFLTNWNANPPFKAGSNSSDEYLYMLWQKLRCCERVDNKF